MLILRSLLVLMLAVLPVAAPALDSRPAIEGTARIIDGDTLDIGAVRIRVHGIDAPEAAERCTRADGSRWRCGDWATRQAATRYDGQRLVCRDLGERTHGRVVAQCAHRGRDIALDLVRAGVVMACPRFALQHAHSRAYLDAEKQAAFAAAGLHAGPLNPRAGFCDAGGTPAQTPVSADAHTGCAIKGNVNAAGVRIYHRPGQRDYARTVINGPVERMFCTEAEARAAGWRPAQR